MCVMHRQPRRGRAVADGRRRAAEQLADAREADALQVVAHLCVVAQRDDRLGVRRHLEQLAQRARVKVVLVRVRDVDRVDAAQVVPLGYRATDTGTTARDRPARSTTGRSAA